MGFAMKEIRLNLEDKDFKKLSNMKERAKFRNECTSWEDYILKLAEVRK